MDEIQRGLYQRELKFREEPAFEARTYDELKERVEQGFVHCWWAGSREDEEKIQEETKATIRVIPLTSRAVRESASTPAKRWTRSASSQGAY